MKIIVVANRKGGVSKTTTCCCMASQLARRGYRVLLIDATSQANATTNSGFDILPVENQAGLYRVLVNSAQGKTCNLQEDIVSNGLYDVLPSGVNMQFIQRELQTVQLNEYLLRPVIAKGELNECYDFVLLDTEPEVGIAFHNAMVCADYVIAPITPGINELGGAIRLITEVIEAGINPLRKRLSEPKLEFLGVLMTQYHTRKVLPKTAYDMARAYGEEVGFRVFNTKIRESTDIGKAASDKVKRDIYEFAPKCNAAVDYEAFVDEVLQIFGYPLNLKEEKGEKNV